MYSDLKQHQERAGCKKGLLQRPVGFYYETLTSINSVIIISIFNTKLNRSRSFRPDQDSVSSGHYSF